MLILTLAKDDAVGLSLDDGTEVRMRIVGYDAARRTVELRFEPRPADGEPRADMAWQVRLAKEGRHRIPEQHLAGAVVEVLVARLLGASGRAKFGFAGPRSVHVEHFTANDQPRRRRPESV